jgi:GNAT superfamily N-acetyltransferase
LPVVFEPNWVGRRVTLRRVVGRSDDGRIRFGDVVGDLLHVGADLAVIDTRNGPVEVVLDTVAAAKLAPPSTADELALEAIAARGWRPAETARLGGWVLRANAGFTGRGNSVLPLRAPGRPLDEALPQAAAWYAERGLPLKFAVPTEARWLLDAELAERGWPASPDIHVMVARLDTVRADAAPGVAVELADRPDTAWLARYRDGAGTTPAAQALLTRHDTVAFAAVRDGGEALAIGRGVVDDGWLGVSAVEVDPAVRRRGLGTAVVAALEAWGRDRAATRGYLQVDSRNDPAVALYTRRGYWVHHDYRYRTAP